MLCDNCQKGIKQKTRGVCLACGDKFIPNNQTHVYCGSIREKWGCAWKRRAYKQNEYAKSYYSKVKDDSKKGSSIPSFYKYTLPEVSPIHHPERAEFWFTS